MLKRSLMGAYLLHRLLRLQPDSKFKFLILGVILEA